MNIRMEFGLDLGQGNENPFSLRWANLIRKRASRRQRIGASVADWTFGTEELSTYSQYIQQVEKEPCLFMHPKDAMRDRR